VRVTNSNINFVFNHLRDYKILGGDSETTGLKAYKEDRIFAFTISFSATEGYYFDERLVDMRLVIPHLVKLAANPKLLWFFHNAKFDLHFFSKLGVYFAGLIHDTEVIARLIKNDEMSYTLDWCARRAKLINQKLADVKDYCLEHGHWEWEVQEGKKNRKKNYKFIDVPFTLMETYTLTDGYLVYELGMWQLKELEKMDKNKKEKVSSVMPLVQKEYQITKILFDMEATGVQLDSEYTRKSYALEVKKFTDAANRFETLTGIPFKDSDKLFVDVFRTHGLTYGTTEKGNPSFTKGFLEPQRAHPVVSAILDYRDSFKVAGAYYQTFLHHADANDVLHANIRQSGAATGRFSVTDPPLQTLKKDESEEEEINDETKSQVRRCLVPRENYRFVMIDYKQMEYRVMLDYAAEMTLIEQVAAGVDVHQATADLVGCTRKHAKTVNFGLLYGTGVNKLAEMLKLTPKDAKDLKGLYFSKLPQVEKFINNVINTAKREGRIYNRFGRVYSFLDRNYAYKAPNYLIQGGCSDAMRTAMIECHKILQGTKSRMLMQIHDELLFEIHESELHVVPLLREAMIVAYPHRLLAMDCDIEYSATSWQDKKAWDL
jgi:DNA polymerase-1